MMVHLFAKNQQLKYTTIKVVLALAVIFIFTVPLYLLTCTSSSPPWLSFTNHILNPMINFGNSCNIFRGKWIYYPNGANSYTNLTCSEIFDQQNCMKFGRPDSEYLKWRWKPTNCELPLFNPVQFLELVRGKSMAFVGDSLGRNQMQSLLCLLATVVYPKDVSSAADRKFKRWLYMSYNFTLASFWSPYLVKAIETEPNGPIYDRLMNLYLDEANPEWAGEIETFDYVIISAGRWFFGPQIFYENRQVVGCHLCHRNDIENLTMFYGYRRAFRTSFRTLLTLEKFKGMTFLRTLSPAHFEKGEWNKGGQCTRTWPVSKLEMKLAEADLKLYWTQLEELNEAEKEGNEKGLKFKLMDVTEAMVMRPDGHPNHFGHGADENVTIADCVHWCLPGPIDTWNAFLLHVEEDNARKLRMRMIENCE
ncbi:hypothetical protein FNV43_RR13635 [Rhamnella rubrinervis]|uniref:Trichome birefringence-like N-terminal domain-containing protein n=1 Tax=Rhamnella rubrinervis TaxID=2594499 RepID=A0A8K0MFG3_9ROSA|nr:hypothetical protein FNV43_RR13635 [Rhamnella rubrinervis]